ncbi:hypothetical protein [Marinobacterium marinum]|uniref:Uncharacterized protein n=1 Tax=Marinobacterium marinum TaxID=2756129 RepID=A0A7W1WVT9_9GAMM|nr:hypothetical protein [Marinobacterium marinum]MBA4501068.1 hypothetical protein [Marinobacterium marinum]
MIWNLVATVFAGLGAAGIALILRLLSRKKLPKWIIPACAGIGMLSYQIYIEYTWFDFKRSQLPETAEVVASESSSMVWRPWTYLKPMTVSFSVVDRNSIHQRLIAGDSVVEFVHYRFEKSYVDQVEHQLRLLNCNSGEMLVLNESGQPLAGSLQLLERGAPLRRYLCR